VQKEIDESNELIEQETKIIPVPIWNEPKTVDDAQIRIERLGTNMHQHAYLVGKDLKWVKKQLKHEEFLPWINDNLWFGERTAQHFMRFAKECDDKGNLLEYHGHRTFKNVPGTFLPKVYDVWNFSECDDRFGIVYPGRIPGQLIMNLLNYYTEENDIVVDFMAGGGTTYDVCKEMNRICYCYDRKPTREFIVKHELRDKNGVVKLPQLTETPNLIFTDPPYWSMMKKEYGKGAISELSLKEYYEFIEKFASECYKLLDNGFFAFLIQNQTEKDIPVGEEAILHTHNCSKIIEGVGFKLKRIINCPLHTQTFLPQQVNKAKEETRMLGLVRDLLVFKKCQEK